MYGSLYVYNYIDPPSESREAVRKREEFSRGGEEQRTREEGRGQTTSVRGRNRQGRGDKEK